MELGVILALLGAVISVTAAGTGSAIAVKQVGEALAGLVSEEPDKFGKGLILQLLPGTQGIYGLIVSFMVLLRIGIIGTPVAVTAQQGLVFLLGCLPIAIVGLISALLQGKVALAGIMLLAKRGEEAGKGITMATMVETYAVLALLISLLTVLLAPVG